MGSAVGEGVCVGGCGICVGGCEVFVTLFVECVTVCVSAVGGGVCDGGV